MSTESKARSKSPCKITVTDDDATNKLIINFVKKRSIIKGRHTKFVNHVNTFNVNENLPIQTQLDLKLRMQGAMNLFKEFSELQSQIEESILEVDLEEQLIQRESFESLYYNTLARAECLLKAGEVATSSKNSSTDCVKLPTISVPTFDGSYEHWLEFRDTFQSLIHNADHIHAIQKFHYLKSSLKGSAALVIDSLEFSASNYAVAWELLLTRYNNSRLLVHNHVKSLFNIQALSKESPESLRNLIDTILKNLRALKLLGEPVDHWDTLVVYIVTTKLDKVSEREWEHYKITSLKQAGDSMSNLKLDDLLTFLRDRADMLETLQVSHGQSNVTKRLVTSAPTKFHCNVSTNNHNTNTSRTQIKKCILCKSNHPLYACQAFLNFNIQNKLEFVKTNQLCENCLRAGHRAIECRFGSCKKCNKKHNSLIHNDNEARNGALNNEDNKPVLAMHSSRSTQHSHAESSARSKYATNDPCVSDQGMQPVLLSTALVEVKDKQNKYRFARALLDSGSERCIITQSLCDILGTKFIQSTQEIRGIGNSITQSTRTCNINIKSHITSYSAQIQCFVLPQITSTWPAIPKQYAQFGIPGNLQLADPKFREPQSIDLLLGADIFWDLLCDGKMRLPSGPYLQNTQLGWIISGPIGIKRDPGTFRCNFSLTIENQLRKFWELEELPTPSDTRTEEERHCENHFVTTTTRNGDGRFCVQIPLKSSAQSLGETYSHALTRFRSLEKRLQRAPEYKGLYSDFMHEYLALGHMTRIESYASPNFFMPHHGVLREHSSTTKLRVVFDASAASSTGVSFNDIQLVGPPIQGDLLGILLRLRLHKYIACADVEKMYRQVEVTADQRDLQLILWRDDPMQPIGVYKHNRIVYGTASAAFMAVRCLKETAAGCVDPEVKRIINEDFFVDDMITGHDDKDTLLKVCENTFQVLQSGCFPLRKWIFNSRESFREEFNLVSKNKSLRHKPSLSKLNLFVDCNNLIRVGGRISNSEHFDYEQKHPVLLCSKHRFSVLLMRCEHQRLLHAAPQALLYNIRQRWWLIGGRNLARKIVHECVTCKRLKGKTLSPIMGNLPKERLTPTYPFRRSGVDYAGPVFILNRKGRGARTVKAYICLFVCFVTRAVHLELVSDLSAEAYILTLKRFISRRGKPDEIFSDNAKNFVGAKNELAKFLTTCATDIVDYAASQAIKFKFIPCYAAHFGGLWEAGVKSCKLHLARVIGNAHLTFEEFTTVLTQVEAILNSRPLSPLSSDPYDFLPLSPGHFLVGRPLTSPVYQDMRNEPRGLLNRYQRVEQIRQHFWSRWAKEYVSELQTRCRWRENGDSLQPNTMVIIKDDKLPPLKWKIGRIISTVVDKEGVSRVADIRTGSGAIVRRAFSKICPLFQEDDG